MYSKHVPFEEIIDGVKDDTGITNLRNQYPQIRRLIYRTEQDIGFGNSLLLKRVTYKVSDGSLIVNGKNRKIKFPDDLVKLESVGMCHEGICPGDYRTQGNWMFICKEIDSFSLIYYALMCDGEGNPMTTQNHKEAVISGVTYYMYKAKMWNKEGSMNYLLELKRYYEDRIGESRGDDCMPSTKEEWSAIAAQLKMSYSQTLIYNNERNCYCCVENKTNPTIPDNENTLPVIYWWQYEDLFTDISAAPSITEEFLNTKNTIPLVTAINGNLYEYIAVGRIAFAITNIEENDYSIFDIFNINITNIVFDTYYLLESKTQIYISKEYHSNSSIYFKLIRN